jgi:hypothetical protein
MRDSNGPSNQAMKPTAPWRCDFSVLATTPCVAYLFLVRSMPRLAIIAAIALVSCQRSPKVADTCAEADKLRWVRHANVQEDFRQHVEREHDMRFLSVFGLSFATEFPGLQDSPENQRLVQEHGSRRIEGTTDNRHLYRAASVDGPGFPVCHALQRHDLRLS